METSGDSEQDGVTTFERTVAETIREHRLIASGERIGVAVSGGKDSTALLYVLHKLGYDVEALTVDVEIGCYTKENLKNIEKVCKSLNVPLHVISYREHFGGSVCYVKSVLDGKGHNFTSCTLCGVPRRYLLNRAARELGVSKIALGHNLDDEAQAVLMNLFRNRMDLNARLGPLPGGSGDPRFIPRIKPLYFIPEKTVAEYSKAMDFPVHYGRCPCSADASRNLMRKFLEAADPVIARRVVDGLLAGLPALRARFKGGPIGSCERCGEPSSTSSCRTCQLLDLLYGESPLVQQHSSA
mgnify:CR=1 FL=1